MIADAMRSNDWYVELHDDHLAVDAPDEDWISLTGDNDWIAITEDKNIRYRSGELLAIRDNFARVIVLRAKRTTGEEKAELLVKYAGRIQDFARKNDAPFVAGIVRNGRITKYNIQPRRT